MPRPRAGASRSPMLRSSRSISITVWYAPSLARQRRSVPPGRKSSNAEGEQQAAQKLVEAAHILAANPGAMQLRYLATLHAIASERSSTIVFPFPIDIGTVLTRHGERPGEPGNAS
jgi:hypothetical protein